MQTEIWNLKDIIQDIRVKHPSINEIYLFGSRAYRTESRRSDIDILAFCPEGLSTRDCNEWLHKKYPPVDLFKTTDFKFAESVVNGSTIRKRDSLPLVEQLEAILLWSASAGFSTTFADWEQATDKNINFKMTIAAQALPANFPDVISDYAKILEKNGIPNTLLGTDWLSIGQNISEIINRSTKVPPNFNTNAKSINQENLKIKTEYDFQNLIHLILAPWMPTLEREASVIKIDGQDKRVDFQILKHKILIEAKHITDASTKASVLKTLDGLQNFYQDNPSVRLLIFLVLVNSDVNFDDVKSEHLFSNYTSAPIVLVKIIKNQL